jgi:hypothetical protein
MTQERLRDLLRERVADETMPDHSARAWQAARVVRRRRRLGAAAGVVATTVAVSGGIAVLDSTPSAPPTEPGTSDATTRPATPASPDTTYEGVPVWWSPDQDEEQTLPPVPSPLPEEIELRKEWNGWHDDPMDRAYAVFTQGRSMTLIGPDDTLRYVPTPQVEKVTKANGYRYLPPPELTPDGERVVFVQDGGRFAIYDVAGRTWSYDVAYDAPDGRAPDPGFDTGSAQRYGPAVDGAATWGMGVPIPVRDDGTILQDPDFLAARGSVLAFMWRADEVSTRYKNCCPLAGWLDEATVVYESRQGTSLLVAWQVGTHEFGLVARINGAYDASSFAL